MKGKQGVMNKGFKQLGDIINPNTLEKIATQAFKQPQEGTNEWPRTARNENPGVGTMTMEKISGKEENMNYYILGNYANGQRIPHATQITCWPPSNNSKEAKNIQSTQDTP